MEFLDFQHIDWEAVDDDISAAVGGDRVKVPVRRLSNPVESENRRKVVNGYYGIMPDFFTPKQEHMFRALGRVPGKFNFSWESEKIYSLLLSVEVRLADDANSAFVRAAYRTARDHLAQELDSMKHYTTASHYETLAAQVRSSELDPQSVQYSAYAEGLELFRDQLARLWVEDRPEESHEFLALSTGLLEAFQGHAFFTPTGSDITYLLDNEQVLLIADTVTGRRNSLISSTIARSIRGSTCIPVSLVREMYRRGDAILEAAGAQAYEALASWEGLFLGRLIGRDDRLPVAKYYFQSVVDTLRGTTVYLRNQKARMCINELIEFVGGLEKRTHLSEGFGMFRLFGHPTVDISSACKKMQKVGKEPKLLDQRMLDVVAAHFIRRFIEVYITKHHCWPACSYKLRPNGNPASLVSKVVREKRINIPSSGVNYDLLDWLDVEFEQSYQRDLEDMLPELIADRSVSVYAPEYDTVFEAKTVPYRTSRPTTKRRLISELINRKDLDICAWMEQWCRGNCPERWKVMRVALKEREMKLEGRLYALTVFEVRMILVAMDHLTSQHVASMFPEISSYLSEKELKDLIQGRMSTRTLKDWLPIVLNFDFKSWNLQFRQMSTERIFQVLDQVMGLIGGYTHIHPFFEECMFYATSQGRAPAGITEENRHNPPCSAMLWYQHLGGAEGLAQKAWNLVTLALVVYIKAVTGHDLTILGQGDNQVILWRYRPPTGSKTAEEYLESEANAIGREVMAFFGEFCDITEKWGLPVKKSEAWFSSNVFAFNKEISAGGVELPISLKKITRVIPATETRLPTLQEEISTVCSGTYAATNHDTTSLPALATGYFVALTVLRHQSVYSFVGKEPLKKYLPKRGLAGGPWDGLDEGFMKLFLATPQGLGGYMSMCFMGTFYRGHADAVTLGLEAAKALFLSNPSDPVYSRLAYYLFETLTMDRIPEDLRLLIQDPTALNLQGGGTMKELLLEPIREYIRARPNIYTEPLGDKQVDQLREEILLALSSMRPFNPLVASEIFTRSFAGAADSTFAALERAQTIQEVVPPGVFRLIAQRVHFAEVQRIHTLARILDGYTPPPFWKPICATQRARSLRCEGWGLSQDELEASTTPFPLSYMKLHSETECLHPDCRECSFLLIIDPASDRSAPGTLLAEACGKFSKYLGGSTKEKKVKPVLQLEARSSPIRDAQRLVEILSYVCSPDSHLAHLLVQMISQRCDIPFEYLKAACSEIVGRKTHRFFSARLKSVPLYNGRLNVEGFCQISVDNFHKVLDKEADILFQALYLVMFKMGAYHAIAHEMVVGDPPVILHGTCTCQCCIREEPDSRLDLKTPVKLTDVKHYKFLFTPDAGVRLRGERLMVGPGELDRQDFQPQSPRLYRVALAALASDLVNYGMHRDSAFSTSDRFDVTQFSISEFARVDLESLLDHVGRSYAQKMFLPLLSTAWAHDVDPTRFLLRYAALMAPTVLAKVAEYLPMRVLEGAREAIIKKLGPARGMQLGGKGNIDLLMPSFLRGVLAATKTDAEFVPLFLSGGVIDALALTSSYMLNAYCKVLWRGPKSLVEKFRHALLEGVHAGGTSLTAFVSIAETKRFVSSRDREFLTDPLYSCRPAADWRRILRDFPLIQAPGAPPSFHLLVPGTVRVVEIAKIHSTKPGHPVSFARITVPHSRLVATYSHHYYKFVSSLSISAYHFTAIFSIILIKGDVVVLGDATGSVSKVLQATSGVTGIYGSTLQDSSHFAPHRIAAGQLPEASAGVDPRLMRREYELAIKCQDMSNQSSVEALLEYCPKASLVISDMEDFSTPEVERRAIFNTLRYAAQVLDEDGSFLVRVYASDLSLSCGLIDAMHAVFRQVSVLRPAYLDETTGLLYLKGTEVYERPVVALQDAAKEGLCLATGEGYIKDLRQVPLHQDSTAGHMLTELSKVLTAAKFAPTWVSTVQSLFGPSAVLQEACTWSHEENLTNLIQEFKYCVSQTKTILLLSSEKTSKGVKARPAREEREALVLSARRILTACAVRLLAGHPPSDIASIYHRSVQSSVDLEDLKLLTDSLRTEATIAARKGTIVRLVLTFVGQIQLRRPGVQV